MITMSKYLAGIRPTEPGYERFEIKPSIGIVNEMECVVPAVKGLISLTLRSSNQGITMTVIIPENTVADVYIPVEKLANKISPEYPYVPSGEYGKVTLGGGTNTF